MLSLILRGVLLPLIFLITFQVTAKSSIDNLFNVFYFDLKSYDKWVKSERDNTFKDIFINLYNLPAKKRRKYSNNVDLKVMDSFSDDKVNTAYTYLEFKSRTSVNFVIWGIKKGSVKINGSDKGDIEVKNDTGFSVLKVTFEKGVYFISLKINKRFEGLPILVLSDKEVIKSSRGFNREASSSAKIYNIKAGYPETEVSELYRGFCFPYGHKKNRPMFYGLSLKGAVAGEHQSSLIFRLFELTLNEKRVSELKKTGFSESQLKWWKDRMFKKEVCSYE